MSDPACAFSSVFSARGGFLRGMVRLAAGVLLAGGVFGCDIQSTVDRLQGGEKTPTRPAPDPTGTPERMDYSRWVAPLNGYPEHFSANVGDPVAIYYASEQGDAHPFLGGYTIHDLVDDTVLAQVTFMDDWPPITLHPCESWYGAGCAYPGRLILDTETFPAGTYYVVLRDFLGRESHKIYFNLRPPPTAPDLPRVVLLYPTFTYAAYSRIGGGSLYGPPLAEDHWEASLQRPIPFGRDKRRAFNSPESMGCFAARLREMGIPYLSLSSLDVHTHPEYLANAELVLIGPHDEYWSRPVADAVDTLLDRGGRVAIFGGGTRVWQVEVLPTAIRLDRQPDPPAGSPVVSGSFSSPSIDRPPAERFGLSSANRAQAFPRNMTVDEALQTGLTCDMLAQLRGITIADPSHPIFAGTGLHAGDVYGALLGVFWRSADGVPLLPDGTVNYAEAPRAPVNLRVLAHVPHYEPDGDLLDRIGIVAETWNAAGGRVVNFGSYGWFRSVCSDDPIGAQIFDNTIRYLLESD